MGYKLKTEVKGMRVRSFYEETPTKTNTKKGKIREQIEKQISDKDDLIADAFKLNFLTISALKYIYDVLPDDAKNNIPNEAKEFLDKNFKKYEETQTIMDLYLKNGDNEFIDRVLNRQQKITSIVKKYEE